VPRCSLGESGLSIKNNPFSNKKPTNHLSKNQNQITMSNQLETTQFLLLKDLKTLTQNLAKIILMSN